MHVQHMLRERDLSNQVNIIKALGTCTHGQEDFALISPKLFLSRRYAVQIFRYNYDRQKGIW